MKFFPAHRTAKTVFFFLFSLLFPLTMMAQAPTSGDTFVLSSTPRSSYGGYPLLAVQQGANSYIQFNLSSIPANSTIGKATLRLYVDSVGRAGNFDVFEINSTWSENTLVYNNAPPLGNSATNGHSTSISNSSLNQFVLIDITPLVQQWIDGTTPNNGVALSLTGSGAASRSTARSRTLLAISRNWRSRGRARPGHKDLPDRRALPVRKDNKVFPATSIPARPITSRTARLYKRAPASTLTATESPVER